MVSQLLWKIMFFVISSLKLLFDSVTQRLKLFIWIWAIVLASFFMSKIDDILEIVQGMCIFSLLSV
jgi:hypothetical protein